MVSFDVNFGSLLIIYTHDTAELFNFTKMKMYANDLII